MPTLHCESASRRYNTVVMKTLRAYYDGRAFVPDEPIDLPEGTLVTITVVSTDGRPPLADLADLAEKHPITDAPTDWSQQHDHYIHGAPKR